MLVRAVTGDHPHQSRIAKTELANAEIVAMPLPALCELAWVLAQGYRIASADVAEAIRRLMNGANVAVNRPAAEAGLALLDTGGDFADGVIGRDGARLGAEVFVTFDKKSAKLMGVSTGRIGPPPTQS